MKSRQFIYYFIAFLLALGLRFIGLGVLPLTDKEASLALQALSLARGENPLLSGQPGYILLTSIPFYLSESTNFLARLIPALAGSLLVFTPYFWRDKLGERAAIIAAFLLAIAPRIDCCIPYGKRNNADGHLWAFCARHVDA
jgi:predicted membrane-bound mannosyltransferase